MADNMILINFTTADFQFCKDHGYKKSESVYHYNENSVDHNISSQDKHYIGLVGELAYSKYSNIPVDTETLGHGDGGIDFKNGVDVKCSKLAYPPNLLIQERKMREKTKYYVLAWWKMYVNQVYLMGWISKKDFLENHYLVDYKKGITMRMDHWNLNPMHSLDQLELEF